MTRIETEAIASSTTSGGDSLLFSSVSDESFKLRQNNLFNILEKTEKETIKKDSTLSVTTKNTMTEKVKFHRNLKNESMNSNMKLLRKNESIFKVPSQPFSKFNHKKIPDFKINPHKWTKYTLSDVTDNDLSDKSNTNAALSFLNDIKKNKIEDDVNMNVEETNKVNKITFKKKNRNRDSIVSPQSSVSSQSSNSNEHYIGTKHVMPEYVVGQSVKRVKKTVNIDNDKNISKKNNKEIELKHLFDEEEDDE